MSYKALLAPAGLGADPSKIKKKVINGYEILVLDPEAIPEVMDYAKDMTVATERTMTVNGVKAPQAVKLGEGIQSAVKWLADAKTNNDGVVTIESSVGDIAVRTRNLPLAAALIKAAGPNNAMVAFEPNGGWETGEPNYLLYGGLAVVGLGTLYMLTR